MGPPCMADVVLRHRSEKSQRVWRGVGLLENLMDVPAGRKFTQDILGLSCSGRCVCVCCCFFLCSPMPIPMSLGMRSVAWWLPF